MWWNRRRRGGLFGTWDYIPAITPKAPPQPTPRVFTLGVCAMESKTNSAPMQSILRRLAKSHDFEIVQFAERMILYDDITSWPVVDCLIAFHSSGYPLPKVQEYVKQTRPVVLNDFDSMRYLRSRIDVFRMLQESSIPTPSHIVIDHQACAAHPTDHVFEEHYDYIVYNGLRLNKPFIEKPADADNHNNYVYYPRNAGGGCKKLFRKIKDRSSAFYPDVHQVRRDGTYVYEEFLATFGTDVKVYTVGPLFAHAEARKAPTLDGKVQRTAHGKEVRYPVILTETEKYMAYKVVETFKQVICGFDILRTTSGQSYVCDVNGWSFVKGNVKYYNDCAHIIRMLFFTKLQEKYNFIPRELREGELSMEAEEDTLRKTFVHVDDSVIRPNDFGEELRTVVVVMRHGDRKPKQKLKFETSEPEILAYHPHQTVPSLSSPTPYRAQPSSAVAPASHNTTAGSDSAVPGGGTTAPRVPFPFKKKEVKLKSPEELQELLEKTRTILGRLRDQSTAAASQLDPTALRVPLEHFTLLQRVLERGDGFTGINRKFQIKPVAWKEVETASGEKTVMVVRQLVVAKWGGELTRVGRAQAEDLGKRLRATMYPGDDEGGLLRLHSTFRHDLKIYTSDEGRCQVTSAAFTKGFLDLEGELTPILVQMVVRNAKAHALLDSSPILLEERDLCKQWLDTLLNSENGVDELSPELKAVMTSATGYSAAVELLKHPKSTMVAIQKQIDHLVEALSAQIQQCEAAVGPERVFFQPPFVPECSSSLPHSDTIPSQRDLAEASAQTALATSPEKPSKLVSYGTQVAVAPRFEGSCACLPSDKKLGAHGPCSSCRLIILLSERLQEIRHRWVQLGASWFKKKEQRFDSTKIPDLVDNVRYDLIHHHAHIGTAALQAAISIYTHAEPLAHFIAPAEYGLTPHQKTEIGSKLISKLLKKILADITFFRRDTADQPLFMMHAPPVKPNDLPANTQPASLVTCDKKINGVKIPSTSSALPTTISSAANCHTHQFPPASPENLTPQRSLMEKNIAGANSQSPPFIQPDTSPPKIDSSGGDTSSCPNVTISTSRQPLTLGFPQLRDKSETRSRDKPDTLHTDQGDRNSNSANAGAATVVINTDPLWGHQQPLPPVSHRDSLISSAHVAPSISTPKPSASNKPLVADIPLTHAQQLQTGAAAARNQASSFLNSSARENLKGGRPLTFQPRLKTGGPGSTSRSSSLNERTMLYLSSNPDDGRVAATEEQKSELAEHQRVNESVDDDDDDHDDTQSHFRLKEEEAKEMGIKSPWRIVRSRYYVASASHIISLFNILLHGSSVLNEAFEKNTKRSVSWTASSSPDLPSLESPATGTCSHHVIDPHVLPTASSVTDIHYLSHIVFRVWEKRDVSFQDPRRFRLEILFSTGAKDGFGSNYKLLREHAQKKQILFQRHLNHLLIRHAAPPSSLSPTHTLSSTALTTSQPVFDTDAIEKNEVLSILNDRNVDTVEPFLLDAPQDNRHHHSTATPQHLPTTQKRSNVAAGGSLSPYGEEQAQNSSEFSIYQRQPFCFRKAAEDSEELSITGLRFSESVSRIDCESLLSEAEEFPHMDTTRCQHLEPDTRRFFYDLDNSDAAKGFPSSSSNSGAELLKDTTGDDEQASTQDDGSYPQNRGRDQQRLSEEPVPPYCEISPLLRLTKDFPVESFETVMQTLLRRTQNVRNTASSAASLAASKSPVTTRRATADPTCNAIVSATQQKCDL